MFYAIFVSLPVYMINPSRCPLATTLLCQMVFSSVKCSFVGTYKPLALRIP